MTCQIPAGTDWKPKVKLSPGQSPSDLKGYNASGSVSITWTHLGGFEYEIDFPGASVTPPGPVEVWLDGRPNGTKLAECDVT